MQHSHLFLGMSLPTSQLLKQIDHWLCVSCHGLWPQQIQWQNILSALMVAVFSSIIQSGCYPASNTYGHKRSKWLWVSRRSIDESYQQPAQQQEFWHYTWRWTIGGHAWAIRKLPQSMHLVHKNSCLAFTCTLCPSSIPSATSWPEWMPLSCKINSGNFWPKLKHSQWKCLLGCLPSKNQYVDTKHLQDLIMTMPHPVQPTQGLFLVVSLRATKNAFLIKILVQHYTSAQIAIKQLWKCLARNHLQQAPLMPHSQANSNQHWMKVLCKRCHLQQPNNHHILGPRKKHALPSQWQVGHSSLTLTRIHL